jgi:hypothetical protein
MGHAIPRQQPAVVLRSRFDHLRALLAVTLAAVVGLTVAVVILASDSDGVSSTSAAKPVESTRGPLPAQPPNTGYEPGTRDPLPAQPPNTGYEPGTRGPLPSQPPNTGYEPGTRGPLPAQQPNTGYEPGTRDPLPAPLPNTRYDGDWGLPLGASAKDYGKNGATGDYAHGPLPPEVPAKDYSKNAATGD